MKTIGEMIDRQGQNGNRSRKTSCAVTSTGLTASNDKMAIAVRQRYGNFEKFIKTFSPGKQAKYCQDPQRCVTGYAPTLVMIERAYGNEASSPAKAFLLMKVVDLSEISGAKDKLDQRQQDWLCDVLF